MLNASYGYRAPQTLVVPNGTAGWKTLGTIYNGVAGYMSWKDKQKQAERINEAQDKYYDALTKYLKGERQSEPEKPVEVSVAEQVQETPLETQTNDAMAGVQEGAVANMNAPTQANAQTGGQGAYDAYQIALDNMKKQKALEAMQAAQGAGMANALLGSIGG